MAGLLVHEWIEQSGGAERVLDAMLEAFPDATLRCLWNDAPARYPASRTQIDESWLAQTPLRKFKALTLPLLPLVWKSWPGHVEADWALINSHLFAHHARPQSQRGELRRFTYVNSPARYIWESSLDKRGEGLLARGASPYFRKLDRKRAREDGTSWAVISKFVQDRARKSWGIDAQVIYPPVDTERIASNTNWAGSLPRNEEQILATIPGDFILGASRFIPYKGLDDVIRLGERAQIPVVIAGSGPLEKQLASQAAEARVPVTIIKQPSDPLLFALYQKSLAYVFPPIEDFGIMPVEALAAGGKVLVRAQGGASESIQDGLSGIHVEDFRSAEAVDAIHRVSSLDSAQAQLRATHFSKDRFISELRRWVLP